MTETAESAVIDASAIVDLLARTELADAVSERLRGTAGHAPAHLDAEVLSALGRLNRAGTIDDPSVETALDKMRELPVTRHPLDGLLLGAWRHRGRIRLVDAWYVHLAERLDAPLLTTDARLSRACEHAVLIER